MGRKDKPIEDPKQSSQDALTDGSGTFSMLSTEVVGNLGAKLRLARQAKSISLTEMAKRVGYTKSYLSGVENGSVRPSQRLLQKYDETLGLNFGELSEITSDQGFDTLWLVPLRRNPFFTGREHILKELHTKLTSTNTAALTQAQAISGLGGIGKTQLALEYVHRYREIYRYVLWINAASWEVLLTSIMEIARYLHLSQEVDQDQDRVVRAVKYWFEHHEGWLLILDNVEDFRMVFDILPSSSRGAVLLTTRAQTVGSLAYCLEVDTMDLEESILLLLRRARILVPGMTIDQVAEEQRAWATAIVSAMDGLPLALDQAGAYLDETGCSLKDYVYFFQQHKKVLLQRRGHHALDYPASVITTWTLAFEQVEQADSVASELLRCSAWLAPDTIPEELFTETETELGPILGACNANPLRLDEALEVLRRYSLIRRLRDRQMLSIHRLVQAVLKDIISEQEQQIWAERVVCAISCLFPDPEYEILSVCERLLAQAQIATNWIEQFNLIIPHAAVLMHRLGRYWHKRAYYAEAKPLLERALHINKQVYGLNHPETAFILNSLAQLYSAQGSYKQAEKNLQEALIIQEHTLITNDPRTASTLNNLAELYRTQGRYEEAGPLFQQALDICRQTLPPEHLETAEVLNNLGELYHNLGRYEEAEPLFQQALAIKEKLLGPHHPTTAMALHYLARHYHAQEQYVKAEQIYRRALSIQEQAFGFEHPDTAATLNNLARLYRAQELYDQAEALLQRSLRTEEKVVGSDHPYTAITLHNLAIVYQKQGHYEKAESHFKRALIIKEASLGSEHHSTATTLNNLAYLYQIQKRYTEAELLFQRALMIYEKMQGSDLPYMAVILRNLARLYYEQGYYDRVEPFYLRALEIQEKVLPRGHAETVTMLNLAKLYRVQGREEEATTLEQRANIIQVNPPL